MKQNENSIMKLWNHFISIFGIIEACVVMQSEYVLLYLVGTAHSEYWNRLRLRMFKNEICYTISDI